MRARLGKLDLDSKLGILKTKKKACITKYSGVRDSGQKTMSEIQEVDDSFLGQARDRMRWEGC